MKHVMLAAAAATGLVGAAEAKTVRLDFAATYAESVGGRGTHYVEDGFSYQTNDNYRAGGYLYLHDDGGGNVISSTFSAGGKLFDAVNVDLAAGSHLYLVTSGDHPDDPLQVEKMPLEFGITGYRGDEAVAHFAGNSDNFPRWTTLNFSDAFSNLSSLRLEILSPEGAYDSLCALYAVCEVYAPGDIVMSDNWRGALSADNLTLELTDTISPVPLPAGISLLPMALGGLGLVGWRRRKSRAA